MHSQPVHRLVFGFSAMLSLLLISSPISADNGSVLPLSRLARARLAARDSDRDGLPDRIEKVTGMDPNMSDSNNNGVLDGDEKIPGLATTYAKAYSRGYFDTAEAEAEDGEDGDDGDGVSEGSRNDISAPRNRTPAHLPKPLCKRAGQKNCRLQRAKPLCKTAKQRNCRRVNKPKIKQPTPVGAVPTPSGTTPTPRPPVMRPTATPLPGNFDQNGNTTKFGIPAGSSGNISAGASVWAANCAGCHGGEKTGRSYGQLQSSLFIPAMRNVHLSASQLANLTAYLNRANR